MTGPLHRAAPGQQKRLFNGDSEDSDPAQGLRLQASRPVGRRDRGDREADRREGRRPDSAAHPDQQVHRPPQPARRQEVARAVRDPHAQAAPRHPRADSADARRAHEARSLRRRGRGDQVVEATMAKFDVYDLEKKKVGELDLADAVFEVELAHLLLFEIVDEEGGRARPRRRRLRRRGEREPLLRSGQGEARLRPLRHPRGEEPLPRLRWRQEAVEAEAHRPRPPGLDARLAVGRRRQGDGPEAPRLLLRRPEEGAEGGAALRALAPQPGPEADDRPGVEAPGAEDPDRREDPRGARREEGARGGRGGERRAREERAQPLRLGLPPGRGAQRLRHPAARRARADGRDGEAAGGQPVMTTLAIQDVVKRPLITEKNERARELARQFAFEVHRDATKIQVKQAVETLFNVHVLAVRTAIARGKNKRVGRSVGQRPNWKKAFVTLKEGETIALFEGTT